jgi:DNA-binding transcriptional LysR family regulator
MQLRSIKVFCDIVRHRSFSRAADDNGISQSGASQVVHQIEGELGVKLIDRSKRPFVLTPEGETYFQGCRTMFERYQALEDQVRLLHHEVAGRVRVATIYSIGLHLMNRHMQRFMTDHPKANVRLEYLHPHRVYQSVEDDQADIGLVSYPRESRTIASVAWRDEPMVLACSPRHPFAERDGVVLEDLEGQDVVGFDSDLAIRRELDRALQARNIGVRVVMEFDNIETIKRAIEINAGVGLLPAPTVVAESDAGSLRTFPLDEGALVRPLGVIYRRGRELSATAEQFIEMLRSETAADNGIPDRHKVADETAAGNNGHATAAYPSENGSITNGAGVAATTTTVTARGK